MPVDADALQQGPDEATGATADLEVVLERAAERGWVVLSELLRTRDALTAPPGWVDELRTAAGDRGITVVDDVAGQAAPVQGMSSDPVRQYLTEIGRTPLLTHEQEVDLAKRVRAGARAEQLLGGAPTPERARRLSDVVVDGARAKDHMVRANLRLVVSVAKRFRGPGADLLGLLQEGNLGLIRGVERFDPTRGYKFSTYATWWIRQALQRGVATTERVVRLPVHVHEELTRVRQTRARLLQQLGHEPDDAEVAEELGCTVQRLTDLALLTRSTTSFDVPVGEDGDATLGMLVRDEAAVDPEAAATSALSRQLVHDALEGLDEREREILLLRFGLLDGEERTLEDLGARYGLTRERVRQIEKKTLSKLRHPSRGLRLRTLMDAVGSHDG